MKGIKYLIGTAIIIGIILILFRPDSDKDDEVVRQDIQLEQKRQITHEVRKLCSKYNAVTDCMENLNKKRLKSVSYHS